LGRVWPQRLEASPAQWQRRRGTFAILFASDLSLTTYFRPSGVDVKLPFALTGPKTTAGKAVFYMAKVVADILRLMLLSVLMSRTKKTHELLSGLGKVN
jgi:hypothetical protein